MLCKAGVVWSLTTLTKNKARSLITNSVSREVGKLGVWAVAHVAAYYEYMERHSNLLNDIQYHPPPPTRIYTREEVANPLGKYLCCRKVLGSLLMQYKRSTYIACIFK